MDIFTNRFPTTDTIIESLFRSKVERHVLPNGLTLVHRPDFSIQVVSVQIWVKTGSIHEGGLVGSGVSHYLEHLLFKGTQRRDCRAINCEAQAMGGEMNAYTTYDRTVYHMDVPAQAFAQALDLLSDIVLHSTLPSVEVERERGVILREIDMDLDDPDHQLSQALFRTAFRSHPYREPVIGHRNLFEKITQDELRAYYASRYVPNNMVVSIAGAMETDVCLHEVAASFGQAPRGRLQPVQIQKEPVQLAVRREAQAVDSGISRGAIGFKAPHLSHPDSPALDILASVFGGGESSLLWEQLRNRQRLLHYIDCRNWNPGDCGLFWISYVCDPEKQAGVETAIFDLLQTVCDSGFDEADLEKARWQALSREINRCKTVSGQASRLGFEEVVIGEICHGSRYFRRLQEITPQDLQAVAKCYLVKEGMSAVTLGPEAIPKIIPSNRDSDASNFDSFEPFEFKTGARLLLQQDKRLPKVHIRCVMRGGPLYEPENQRGISELMAELLTKDTANRTALEISTLVDRIGGSFLAEGGNNTVSLAIEVLSSDIDIALELLSDALTCPVFEESTVCTERDAQIASLKEDEDEIFDLGLNRLREYYFGAHPFAIASGGRIKDLEQIDREHIIAHFEQLVTAPNIVIAVTGDFERAPVLANLQNLLESKLRSAAFKLNEAPRYNGPAISTDRVETMDREQAVVFQAYPDAGIREESYVAGEMLNELLGGQSSQLYKRVREEKGMAYYVGSSRTLGLNTGMFVLYAGTHPAQIVEVMSEIDREIKRVRAGKVTEEELARCRTRLKAARLMDHQTLESRALHAALNVTYDLPIENTDEYAQKLDKVSLQSITEFARKFFDDQHMVQLVVQP